jgi:hypothetical protein
MSVDKKEDIKRTSKKENIILIFCNFSGCIISICAGGKSGLADLDEYSRLLIPDSSWDSIVLEDNRCNERT